MWCVAGPAQQAATLATALGVTRSAGELDLSDDDPERASAPAAAMVFGQVRQLPVWEKGTAPNIPPDNRAAHHALFAVDAAETQDEWNQAVAGLVHALMVPAIQGMGEELYDAALAVRIRIERGFKAPPRRPRAIQQARDDALWLTTLPPSTLLPDAMRFLASMRGISEKAARDRVLRAERELRWQFPRTARGWRRSEITRKARTL